MKNNGYTSANVLVFGSLLIFSLLTMSFEALANDQLKKGQALYQQNCAQCHDSGASTSDAWKKPNSMGEMPAPPHNQRGHTWRHSDNQLKRMIIKGWRDPFNKSKRLTMPSFKGRLTAQEIDILLGYLKSLWTEQQRIFQKAETKRRDKPSTKKLNSSSQPQSVKGT